MRKLLITFFLVLSFIAQGQDADPIANVRAELETMLEADQSHRGEIMKLMNKHVKDSAEMKEAWSKQNAIDAQNIRRLEEIIAQIGWPGTTQFGKKAASAAFLIVQHSDLNIQKKYLPLMREAVTKGEMKASSLALLEDRIRLKEGQKQIYGSQVRKNSNDEWEPAPLDDEEKVEALRAGVGLGPLSEYLQGIASMSGGTVNPKWLKKTAKESDKTSEPPSPSIAAPAAKQ